MRATRLTHPLLRRYERQAVLLRRPPELPFSVREHLAHAGLLRFLGIEQPENLDAHANFAYSTVATAPSPASSGTSLVVATGDGAKFPAAPFNATVWPTGAQPLSSNAEIVRVTAKSTDTLTITRAQELTSARSIVVGDQIAATLTKKTVTDIETALLGGSELVYRYTVTGSAKASIDTGVDTADAGSNDWTNGDLLEMYLIGRTDEAVFYSVIAWTVNNDTAAHYDRGYISTSSGGSPAQGADNSSRLVTALPGASQTNTLGVGFNKIEIPAFTDTTFWKVGFILSGGAPNDVNAGHYQSYSAGTEIQTTSAITRVKVTPDTAAKNFLVGSKLLIYKRTSA